MPIIILILLTPLIILCLLGISVVLVFAALMVIVGPIFLLVGIFQEIFNPPSNRAGY